MSASRRISFAESAVMDLQDVQEWYRSQSVPEVGDRLVDEVLVRVEQLADFPDSGRIVPEFNTTWLRELIHPPFRIVYRIDDVRVRIVRVWRSERLLDEALGGDT